MRPIGLQLYTLRESFAQDPTETWAFVGSLGLDAVEPYRLVGHEDTLGDALHRHGLSVPSVHARCLGDDQREVFAAAQRLGVPTVIQPVSDKELWLSKDGVERVAAQLNAAAEIATEFGVTVGYHNHAFEFASLDRPLHRLAELLDPRVVLEVDTYWAAVGGADPVSLLKELGDRVHFLHIKDGPITMDAERQVAVGAGAMPIAEVLSAAPDALAIVELDAHSGDMRLAVAESIQYLKELR